MRTVIALLIALAVKATPTPTPAKKVSPVPTPSCHGAVLSVVNEVINAYNRRDVDAFYMHFDDHMRHLAQGEIFQTLYADKYLDPCGPFTSFTAVDQETSCDDDKSTIVFKGTCGKGKELFIRVIAHEVAGLWRVRSFEIFDVQPQVGGHSD